MTWIPVQSSLREHRKVFKLAVALDIDRGLAVAPLVNLWIWSVENAPDGLLEPDAALIAFGACWPGDPDVLLAGLVAAGFLDRTESGQLEIHGWEEHQQHLIKMLSDQSDRTASAREKAKIRMRNLRARRAEEAAPAPRAVPQRSRTVRERDANSSPEPEANIGERSPLIRKNLIEEHPIPHEPPAGDANSANQLVLVPVVALAPPAPESVQGVVVLEKPAANKRRSAPAGDPSYSADFDAFWAAYPKKKGKDGAWFAYQVVTGKEHAAPADLLAAAQHYAAEVARAGTEFQFILYPKTFLGRDRRWREYVEGVPGPSVAEQIGASYRREFSAIDNVVAVYKAMGK